LVRRKIDESEFLVFEVEAHITVTLAGVFCLHALLQTGECGCLLFACTCNNGGNT